MAECGTREQLGGYSIIEADNLDEAIAIASGFLTTSDSKTSIATIEVRWRFPERSWSPRSGPPRRQQHEPQHRRSCRHVSGARFDSRPVTAFRSLPRTIATQLDGHDHWYPRTTIRSSTSLARVAGSSASGPPPGRVTSSLQTAESLVGASSSPAADTSFCPKWSPP